MGERFTYVPLTIDNILSFEDYIPRDVARMILSNAVFGWGVVEDDLVSGAAMVALERNMDAMLEGTGAEGSDSNESMDEFGADYLLRILWLFVDEEVRGNGIGRELLGRCREAAAQKGAAGIYCSYPAVWSDTADAFFISCGFIDTSEGHIESIYDLTGDGAGSNDKVHTAWLRLKGKAQTFERNLFRHMPDAGSVIPRLNGIVQYLYDMGFENTAFVTDDDGRVSLIVSRSGDLCDIGISILSNSGEQTERYSIMVQGTLQYPYENAVMEEYLKNWHRKHPMVMGSVSAEDESVIFAAVIPVEEGIVDEAQFKEFFIAVCEDIDSF